MTGPSARPGQPRRAPRIGGRPTTIASLSTYVPPRLLTNADLEKMVDTDDEWILRRVGIRERHIVDPGVGSSDLAKEAAIRALGKAGITADEVGVIVVGTVTPDMMFPSTACLLQNKIGAHHAWGFDLSAACSAFTYALTTGSQLVATGAHDHALVVGADVMSSIIDYTDRATCVLFGDGAGAVVVSAAADGAKDGAILDFEHEIDRKLLHTIIDKFGGGPVGLNTIAAAISEEKDAIEDIYEPFLIQIGFLDRTPRGRVATPRAYGYFGLTAPADERRDSRLW